MHHRIAAATASAVLAAVLTGCGDSEQEARNGPAKTSAASKPAVDCDDPNLDQAEWMKHCNGENEQDSKEAAKDPMPLGKPAETIGSGGTGELEVTPTTVVYVTEGTGETPNSDLFAVVTVKDRNTGAVAAAESALIENGGWQWVSSDGQAIREVDGNSSGVTPEGFTSGGKIQPGSWVWDSVVLDLTKAQAESGTLMYVDGAGTAHRWKMPTENSGPQTDKLKKALDW